MKFTNHGSGARLKPGVYPVALEDIEETTGEFGDRLIWKFETQHDEKVSIWVYTSTSFNGPRSKAKKLVEGMLGKTIQVGETIDTDELIGMVCRALVTVQTRDDGSTRNVIEQLFPKDDADVPF